MASNRGKEGCLVDLDTGVVRQDRILTQHTPVALLFVGFGRRAERLRRFAFEEAPDHDPFIDRCARIAEAIESANLTKVRSSGLPSAILDIEDRTLRRLAIAEALAKAGFNENEPRDDHGEWTYGGIDIGAVRMSAAPAVSASEDFVGQFGRSGASLFGEVAPKTLAGLAELGAAVAAPTAFLGIILIPTNGGVLHDGAVPGRPDISYEFSNWTGTLTLTQSLGPAGIGVTLFSGEATDGVFRDAQGRVYGRFVDGSIILDPDAFPVQESSSATARSRARAKAQALADTRPQLCPAPEPDRPGATTKNWFYQAYVGMLVNPERPPLPPGIAVRLPKAGLDRRPDPGRSNDWVYFDDCRLADGTMIEAKGRGYLDILQRGENKYPWIGVAWRFVDQAERQVGAARGRPIEWYVADHDVAAYIRKLFEFNKINILVVEAPPP